MHVVVQSLLEVTGNELSEQWQRVLLRVGWAIPPATKATLFRKGLRAMHVQFGNGQPRRDCVIQLPDSEFKTALQELESRQYSEALVV